MRKLVILSVLLQAQPTPPPAETFEQKEAAFLAAVVEFQAWQIRLSDSLTDAQKKFEEQAQVASLKTQAARLALVAACESQGKVLVGADQSSVRGHCEASKIEKQ